MEITIDVRDPLPVFAQLIREVKEAVLRGTLRPGSPLPPIRQLASELQLNPNTVAKAYRILERDSVIETRGRQGSFVHVLAKKHSKIDLREIASSSLAESVQTLRAAGLTDSEIRIAFADVMKE
jgi:GntR family transcriptional regulator